MHSNTQSIIKLAVRFEKLAKRNDMGTKENPDFDGIINNINMLMDRSNNLSKYLNELIDEVQPLVNINIREKLEYILSKIE